jgi:hypothetical protein
MTTESSKEILEKIDTALTALGQRDFDQFRATMSVAAILFANLSNYSRQVSALSREDLEKLINGIPEAEEQRVLRLMSGLEDYLPTLRQLLLKVVEILPRSKGGHPLSFKDRDSERQACELVLSFIEKGKSEADAKKAAAKKLDVDPRTMHRVWKKRVELKEELSFEEFFRQFMSKLSAIQSSESTEVCAEGISPVSDGKIISGSESAG